MKFKNVTSNPLFKHVLKVYARLDETDYPKGVAVSDKEIAKVNLRRHEFHGDWNYTIHPTLNDSN